MWTAPDAVKEFNKEWDKQPRGGGRRKERKAKSVRSRKVQESGGVQIVFRNVNSKANKVEEAAERTGETAPDAEMRKSRKCKGSDREVQDKASQRSGVEESGSRQR